MYMVTESGFILKILLLKYSLSNNNANNVIEHLFIAFLNRIGLLISGANKKLDRSKTRI